MARPIKSDKEALAVALKIIKAQDTMIVAYRTGSHRVGGAIDALNAQRPRLEEWTQKESP